MTSTVDESRSAGVRWVAGVGAFLLVAAAGVFVAVRWNELPAEAKLAVILGMTGASLLVGHTVRRTLPATGGVLFHLGAFLVPIDIVGINLRIGLGWEELLLVEGLVCAAAFAALWRVSGSIVLARAAVVAVVVFSGGIGGTTPVAGPLTLAVIAAAASVWFPRARAVLAWATVAGPALALALSGIDGLAGPALRLGFPEAAAPAPALAAGLIAAVVLVRSAHLERNLIHAFLGVSALVASGVTTLLTAPLPTRSLPLVAAAAFVLVEIVAVAVLRDEFWARPAGWMATAAEAPAAIAALAATSVALTAPAFESLDLRADPVLAVAFALTALGWAASTVRHAIEDAGPAPLRQFATAFTAVSAVAAVVMGTAAAIPAAIAMLVVGASAVRDRGVVGHALTVWGTTYATLTVLGHPVAALAIGAAGAGLLAMRADDIVWRRISAYAVLAPLPAAIGAIAASATIGHLPAALIYVAACGAVGLIAGRRDPLLGLAPLAASVPALVATIGWSSPDRLALTAALAALLVPRAIQAGNVSFAFAPTIALQVGVFDVARMAGLDAPWAGVVLVLSASVWAGLAHFAGEGRRAPFVLAAATSTCLGLVVAASDEASFGAGLIASGTLLVGTGLVTARSTLAYIGGATALTGIWIDLAAADVTVSEAYVGPAAIYLLVAGVLTRRTQRTSSWVAHVPAIVMLSGAAILERVDGGAGWHAVLAGAVGVAAVGAGGWLRLAGPLVSGIFVLVAVTGFESLAMAASVPTWGWLALGGSALLATGIVLERRETTPAEAGRRLVDVLARQFD